MKSLVICALLTPLLTGGGLALWPRATRPAEALPSPSLQEAAIIALAAAAKARPLTPQELAEVPKDGAELQTAVTKGWISAEFIGNGREKMRAILKNRTGQPLVVRVSAGQMLESGRNVVVVAKAGEVDLRRDRPVEVAIQTVATRSANKVGEAAYQLSFGSLPRLNALFTYAQDHSEMTLATMQTAAIALTENLPLSAIAKFSAAGGDLPTKFDTAPFRAETGDILQALIALRAIGVKDGELALTIDQQLKIESMIEPACRAAAMRYYGIAADSEWDYWKNELLNGDPATRHYALYGIARYYPQVALEMLPKWARETKTQTVFRISAIQALADTQRPEALPILRGLSDEFGRETDLGKAADLAAKFLNSQLSKVAASHGAVAFRGEVAKF